MIGIIILGIAGIVFQLGIIVAQIGKDYGTLGSLVVGIVVVGSIVLAALLGLAGLTGVARL